MHFVSFLIINGMDGLNALETLPELPPEVWTVVFEHVNDVKALLALRRVCGLFRAVIGTNGVLRRKKVWVKYRTESRFDEAFTVFGWQGVGYRSRCDCLCSGSGVVHTLDLSLRYEKNVSVLGNVTTLSLWGMAVTDVSALGNVTTLDLSHTDVTDVSMLGNVTTLDLTYTNVTDVSALGNVTTLNLSHTNVTDVSMLENVAKLILPDHLKSSV